MVVIEKQHCQSSGRASTKQTFSLLDWSTRLGHHHFSMLHFVCIIMVTLLCNVSQIETLEVDDTTISSSTLDVTTVDSTTPDVTTVDSTTPEQTTTGNG